MVKATSVCTVVASGLAFSFGVRAWTKMKMWYVEGMYMLKLIS